LECLKKDIPQFGKDFYREVPRTLVPFAQKLTECAFIDIAVLIFR